MTTRAVAGPRRLARAADEQTLYERAGGMPFFEALVARFYDGVADDPILRPIYPEPTWPAPGVG